MKKRVTIKDVASACGVSASVVSSAINGATRCKSRFSADTLERIQQTARQMGYIRLASASTLRTRRTFTIAVVGGFHPQTGWFYPGCNMDILAGINRALAEDERYSLLLDLERTRKNRSVALYEGRVDGALVLEHLDDQLKDALNATDTPYVTINVQPERQNTVYPEDGEGFYELLSQWHSLGVRRIVYLQDATLSEHHSTVERQRLTRQVGQALGMEVGIRLYLREEAPAVLLQTLRQERWQGVVCYHETPAQMLAQQQLLADGEGALLRMFCWSRQSVDHLLLPWIARIAVPFEELGMAAGRMLLQELNGGGEPIDSRCIACQVKPGACEPEAMQWQKHHHELWAENRE